VVTPHTATSLDSVCDGIEHRISVTFDAAAEEMKLYRDGALQETVDTSTDSLTSATANAIDLTAGEAGGGGLDYEGYMSDFRAYNTVITGVAISEDKWQGISDPPAKTGLVGYWPGKDDVGTTTLTDVEGSDDGTLTAATMWEEQREYGDEVLNCGEGSRVNIVFSASRFHGNRYNIYRTLADGVVPFWVGEFEPVSGDETFVDSTEDVDVGNTAYLHGDPPPDEVRPAVVFANRVFVSYRNRVYWTDIANVESFWTDPIEGNWFDVYPDDGDEITALAADRDGLLIFKSSHIYKLYGRSPVDFQLRPIAPSVTVPVSMGAPNMGAVCEVPNGAAFFWNKKVYIYSAESNIRKISDPIEELIDASSGDAEYQYYAANVGYDAVRDYLWVSIPVSSSGPTYSYLYDLNLGQWVGMRTRGYRSMQTIRSISGWQSTFTEQIFAGARDGGDTINDILQVVDPSATTFFGSASYDSSFTLSPFWGSHRTVLKRFLYVDVTYAPQAAGEFVVTFWVDGKVASAETVTIDHTGTADRATERVRIMEVGNELTIKIGNTPSTDGIFKVLSLNYGFREYASQQ
jgi:hypothetical protein